MPQLLDQEKFSAGLDRTDGLATTGPNSRKPLKSLPSAPSLCENERMDGPRGAI